MTNISVNSTNGVVTLSGQVDSETAKDKAGALVGAVPKVVRVVDNLQVVSKKVKVALWILRAIRHPQRLTKRILGIRPRIERRQAHRHKFEKTAAVVFVQAVLAAKLTARGIVVGMHQFMEKGHLWGAMRSRGHHFVRVVIDQRVSAGAIDKPRLQHQA